MKVCIKLPGLVLGHPFFTLTQSAKGHVLPKRKWGAEADRLLGFPFLSLFLAPLNSRARHPLQGGAGELQEPG